jgi:hypothetical protein
MSVPTSANTSRTGALIGVATRRLCFDDAGLPQHPQMVRDVGLPGAGDLDEMTGAELLDGERPHHRRPHRIGEHPDEVAVEIDVS